jgi:hypothetical protein
MSNIIHVQVFPGDLPVLRILAYAKQEARIAELEAALRDISRRMSKDEALFLVERYGYARREGKHQGKGSAEWMAEVGRAIDACVAEAGWPKCMNCGRQFTTADLRCECNPEALADPLAAMERLAQELGTVIEIRSLRLDIIGTKPLPRKYAPDGIAYRLNGRNDREPPKLIPREEAAALLAGKEDTHDANA